ncbi:MAG: hypothetical protein WAU01_12270 [Saprospiraceae bacterium]
MTKVSNLIWFQQYVTYRKYLLISVIIWVFSVAGVNYFYPNPILEIMLYIYPISVILVIVLFDWTQKPGLISVTKEEHELLIELYIPDTRYHIKFDEKKIRKYHCGEANPAKFLIKSHFIKILDKISIQVRSSKGEYVMTPFMSFSWATKVDMENLKRIGEIVYV